MRSLTLEFAKVELIKVQRKLHDEISLEKLTEAQKIPDSSTQTSFPFLFSFVSFLRPYALHNCEDSSIDDEIAISKDISVRPPRIYLSPSRI